MKRFLLLLLTCLSFTAMATPLVKFETNLGDFVVELNSEKAPKTTANFMRYVTDGSYKGTIFHRVIPNFMAQGGGFDQNMQQVPTYAPVQNEANNGLENSTATIAMARTNNPHSATRQFFINYQDNQFLNYSKSNPGYAVFGKVVEGFEIIEKMATIPTKRHGRMTDVPREQIVINNVYLISE